MRAQIEGRGNGIKTNVMNMVEVAKALGRPASCTCPLPRPGRRQQQCQPKALRRAPRRRPPLTRARGRATDTTKYFGTELGAQTKFEEASGLAIVNGAHETHRLSALLEGFIKRFVQCGQCNNPETEIMLTKRETIELQCKACGAVTQVDMRHKLCTFILKNPPVVKDKAKKCAPHARGAAVPSAALTRATPNASLQAAPCREGAHQGGRGDRQGREGEEEELQVRSPRRAPRLGGSARGGWRARGCAC